MREWGRDLRIKKHVADNIAVIVVVVVLVGAIGGYLTYTTHVEPGTQLETREVSSWASTGNFTHNATVVNGTAAFEEGQTLQNRTAYFTHMTPRLNGTFAYAYTASSGGDLKTNTTLSLVLRSVKSGDGDESEVTYWRINRQLNWNHAASLSPDERITIPFSLNVSAVANEIQRVDDQLGGTPGQLRIAIVANVSISGTRNGDSIEMTRTYRLPIELSESVYLVHDPGMVRVEDTETTQVSVPVTYGLLRQVGGPTLVALSLAGLLGLGYATRNGLFSVSNRERSWLAYRSDRTEFDEWISTGTVSPSDRRPTTVTLDSLAGLVNIAIDADSRVIEDTETDAFFVFTDDKRFRYDPPEPPASVDDRPANQDESGERAGGGSDEQRTDSGSTEA